MGNPYITAIQSSHMSDLMRYTNVFNIQELSEVFCIKLPDDFPRHLNLTEIYYLNDDVVLDFEDFVSRNEHHPWIDISKSILDTGIGRHIYRLSFKEPGSIFSISCWFGYIIQDNHPETPYIYMHREENDDDSSDSGSSDV